MLWMQVVRDEDDKGDLIGNYTVHVKVTDVNGDIHTLASGRVEKFRRKRKWKALLQEAMKLFENLSEGDLFKEHHTRVLLETINENTKK